MQLAFTKMHGAGNDFIVVNAMSQTVELSPAQWRALADRHFGIGADQILIVGCPKDTANDFSYRIINADGDEVEHCGNGARAFLRYVVEKGLTDKQRVKVEIQRGVIELSLRDDGQVLVAMGVPEFQPERHDSVRLKFPEASIQLQVHLKAFDVRTRHFRPHKKKSFS